MKTTLKTQLILLPALLGLSTGLSGASIYVSDLSALGEGDFTYESADVAGSTNVVLSMNTSGVTGVSFQDQTYNISGIDIDGVGEADDAVSFTIRIGAWGVTADTVTPSLSLNDPYTMSLEGGGLYWGNTGPLPGVAANSTTNPVGANEGLQFAYQSGTVNLGGGASGLYELQFQGFDEILYDRRSGTPGAVIALDGIVSALPSADTDQTIALGGAQVFAIGSDSTASTQFRMGSLDFGVSVVAVPEPSTAGLMVGLAAVALVSMRRYRNKQ